MLICSISMRPRGHTVAAELAEIATAQATSTVGHVVFDVLVDDPASANDITDAYLGEIMLEAASASDNVSVAGAIYAVDIIQSTPANAVQDAIIIGGAPPSVTPTTWNPSDKSASITLSAGDLHANATSSIAGVRGIAGRANGKFYFEAALFQLFGSGTEIGLSTASAVLEGDGAAGQAVVTNAKTGSGRIWINGLDTGISLGVLSSGNIIGIAPDLTNGLIWFRKTPSGNWNNSATANPATGVGGINLGAPIGATLYPCFGATFGNDNVTANFGATAFNGSVPSGFASGWGT